MIPAELSRSALDLSPEERLELARQLVESVVTPEQVAESVEEGVQRIEEVANGKTQGLTEEQYRASLQ
jgi:putative addiction module component (TIGR02574 family)